MWIRDLCESPSESGKRAEAEIVWEDCDLPTRTLYFETEAAFADDFRASPDGFLLACVAAACWRGERRVRLEGPVCPVMHDHALAVGAQFAAAYPHLQVPRLEVAQGTGPTWPREPDRTASFMSGGVDALTVLRANRLTYPLDHPSSIRDAFLIFGIYGFDFTEAGPVPERLHAWEDLRGRLAGLAERQSFTLVPVYTNVRTFAPDYLSWSRALFSPMTAAAVHGFTSRASTVLLGSEGRGVEARDVAASQTLSQCLSSAALEIRLDLVHLERLERIRLLSEWDEGRALMQPCHWGELPEPGQINCGRCEKCVRTMLALIVLGRLQDTGAFTVKDVTPETIRHLDIVSENKLAHLLAFIPGLARVGRRDLVRAVRRRQRHWRRRAQ